VTAAAHPLVATHVRETVTVVIPAKDEARNIAWVLDALPPDIDEVILVDGRSTDDTVAVAVAARPDIAVVLERGRGKGAAMRTGMEEASGDIIVLLDADGSMDPAEMGTFVAAAARADLVKGSRFRSLGGSDDISPIRRAGNRALLGFVNALYRTQLTDLCYGFCAVRRDALAALALRSDGFEIETEMTVRALRAGLRIAEVPSFEAPRRHGESNLRTFRDGWRVLRTILGERVRTTPAAVPAVVDLTPAAPVSEPAPAALVEMPATSSLTAITTAAADGAL
jgi:glycosyltransferase involved in cell wall biosynthesis